MCLGADADGGAFEETVCVDLANIMGGDVAQIAEAQAGEVAADASCRRAARAAAASVTAAAAPAAASAHTGVAAASGGRRTLSEAEAAAAVAAVAAVASSSIPEDSVANQQATQSKPVQAASPRCMPAAVAAVAAAASSTGPVKRKRRRPKADGHPKAPSGAYIYFVKETHTATKAAHPDVAPRDLMTLVGVAWRALTDTQRQPFIDASTADKRRYAKELAVFRKNRPNEKAAGGTKE